MNRSIVILACQMLIGTHVWAQAAPPTSGDILRQSESFVPQQPVQGTVPSVNLPNPMKPPPGGAQVMISTVTLSGNTLVSEERLLALISDRLNQMLDAAALRELTDILAAHYVKLGYPFVRVYLPEQDLSTGNLKIIILEGRYGAIRIAPGQKSTDSNIDIQQADEVIRRFVADIKPGDFISGPELERKTLLLDDIPGMKITPIIKPGQSLGSGDLDLRYDLTQPFIFETGVDNHGSRFTGSERAKADMTWNSLFSFGDQLKVVALRTSGHLNLGTTSYAKLLSGDGLRLKGSYTFTDYNLGKDYASLQRYGTVKIYSVGLIYPWLRSQAVNLSLSAMAQTKFFYDNDGLQQTLDKKNSRSFPISAQFDFRDSLFGGGINFGYVTLTQGQMNLSGAALSNDQSGPQTQGQFTKTELDFSRIQALAGSLTLSIRFYQQFSIRKNLDASEGVSFGGPTGVRAFPVGEGSGDEGHLSQIELRHAWQEATGYLFYDQARVKINAVIYDSSANLREFSGAGVGFRRNQTLSGGHTLSSDLSFAWTTSGGPAQSDAAQRKPRVWFAMTYRH